MIFFKSQLKKLKKKEIKLNIKQCKFQFKFVN